jgi:hypothetical protein
MELDGELPNVALRRLKRSEQFRSDVRTFQEDLGNGHLEPSHLEAATRASKLRAEGEFDDWKTKERELFWGMNLDVEVPERDELEEEA